jgi:hypothetical protein
MGDGFPCGIAKACISSGGDIALHEQGNVCRTILSSPFLSRRICALDSSRPFRMTNRIGDTMKLSDLKIGTRLYLSFGAVVVMLAALVATA